MGKVFRNQSWSLKNHYVFIVTNHRSQWKRLQWHKLSNLEEKILQSWNSDPWGSAESATAESELGRGILWDQVTFWGRGDEPIRAGVVRVRRIRLALWVSEKLQTESGTATAGMRSSTRTMVRVTARQTGSHRKQEDVSSLSSSSQPSCPIQYSETWKWAPGKTDTAIWKNLRTTSQSRTSERGVWRWGL